LIRLNQLNKSYVMGDRTLHVLKDLDLVIPRGEFVAIMGSSGSGKSTLLNILGILDTYDTGHYELDGTPIVNLSEQQAAAYRNQFIGFVFQSFHLLAHKTAEENVALPLLYSGVPRQERRERARKLLDEMGLLDWANHFPSQLSGGQQQRVAIARSLVTRPSVVLADEPTGALDSTTSRQIMETLESIHAQGMTLIVVTHEKDIAARAQRIIRLHDGQIVNEP
jgi:putative ABC transport system ATP-binding protein